MMHLNTVQERLMFLSPVVQAGWEKEAKIDDFEKMADLGQGAFGLVSKMKHKNSNIIYAVKQMDKKRLKNSGMIQQITTEIKIMYSLTHENIIKLFNHFEDNAHIYLVIEYAPGGQLWDKLQKAQGKRIPEKEAAQYVKDLVSSLEYLHEKGIIHRDIKPENLLIDGKGRLKLADFGWSNYFKSDAQSDRSTFCGTLDYLAPEMLESGHQHNHMVDIWAIGVLVYELLTGKSPFSPTNPSLKMRDIEKGTQQNILEVKYEIPKEFPSLAKDLVSKILRKNPRTRLNLSEIKSHPWVKCNAFVVKTKELDHEAFIKNYNFGQTMAEQKKFIQINEQEFGVKPAFTEEEIIQYARPDSMLDKQLGFGAASKTAGVDTQLEKFRQQMGWSGATTPTANTSKPDSPYINLGSTYDSSHLGGSNLSVLSEEASPSRVKDLEIKLRIKTDECNMLQQELERYKKVNTNDPYSQKVLQEENTSLRNQVSDLYKKLAEKDMPSPLYKNTELEAKVAQLESQLARDKQYYEGRIMELELKAHSSPLNGYSSPVNDSYKLRELEEVVNNMRSQIVEYEKLIKRMYESSPIDGDTEKKRLLDDIKTLRSLTSMKQDRIEKLEAKLKTV